MELLPAYQEMIKVHGWVGTAATLGMTRSALEARVYEVKGSGMRVETALLIQAHSGTTYFAEAVAKATGGIYVDLPNGEGVKGLSLEDKFHELYDELGTLSRTYSAATKDGEIDPMERAQLEAISDQMHKTMKELMGLMFHVYCRSTSAA